LPPRTRCVRKGVAFTDLRYLILMLAVKHKCVTTSITPYKLYKPCYFIQANLICFI